MGEVDVVGLIEAVDDPMLRHQVAREDVLRAWVDGAAAVVEQVGRRSPGPALLCLGPADDLGPLMAEVARGTGRPGRVVLDAHAHDLLPASWVLDGWHGWTWMLTRDEPPHRPGPQLEKPVAEVLDVGRDAASIEAVLALANPGTSARRDLDAAEHWVGVRDGDGDGDGGALLAVGAVVRRGGGAGHLAGIAVLPTARRRGLGEVVTDALTRLALAPHPHVATLGLYTENLDARRLYERLGYEAVHELVSVTRSS